MASPYLLSVSSILTLLALTSAQKCPLQFDGRIPSTFTPTSFDAANAFFSQSNVLGQGLKFSQLIQLPSITPSLFDTATVPVGVTISDKSIFAPSADNVQTGFRRAELLPASNSGTDASTAGVKTLHFSVMKDGARPLNLSHEYQLVFLESNDFSTNQLVLKTGTVIGAGAGDPDTLQLFGNVNESPPKVLFSTPFQAGVFHNFGVMLDFDKLTSQVFFSTGTTALKAVTQALANDVSGQGQFHFGVLKKGIGGNNIVKDGVQEAGIDEGIIFGGIFEEDSSAGCVSLSP
ncbi:hypothetical protein CONLIGDRAFT_699488 [Coniochaeta ligniaria NRRL 30616]|uniref:Glycoside hydrolase 131 catalytic N-terminal domain-containing protein n=1 Tax=Coniochaeta ligniaria NRRL 30616 TaxID=1408157 RepID=A0A1J7IY11_9PEZI|nr:hypothetical protein CONLIGDRAFT_699488 [Coniochaeta ligniaria NRRL 30616]